MRTRSARISFKRGKSARTAVRRSSCMIGMVPAPTRGLSADSALNDPDGEDEGVIRFSIDGIPVTVRPSFWLVALLLGWGVASRTLLVAWVVVVFVSVLAHDLGYAMTARRLGGGVSNSLATLEGLTR